MNSKLFIGYDAFVIDFLHQDKYNHPPLEQFHDSFELLYYIRADISIFVENKNNRISDGDMLIISPYDIHRVSYIPDREYSRYHIQFKPVYIEELARTLGLNSLLYDLQHKPRKLINLSLIQRAEMDKRFRTLFKLYQELQSHPENVNCKASIQLELMMLLLRFNEWVDKNKHVRPIDRNNEQIQEWTSYLDEHCLEPIQLDQLASHFNKSKYYISHAFKENTQFTIVEYVQYRRIAKAREMLTHTRHTTLDIGLDCGFQSLQHFYRVFKKVTGKTPAQYRNEYKDSEPKYHL